MITRAKLSSVVQGLPKYRSMLAGNPPSEIPSGFYSIATATATGSETSLTFTSIPATWKSLHLRSTVLDNLAQGRAFRVRFNGDTGTNYTVLTIGGAGAGLGTFGATSASVGYIEYGYYGGSTSSGYPTISMIDVIDYANTSKLKTGKTSWGTLSPSGNNPEVGLNTFTWNSTTAISSITVTVDSGTAFANGTTVSLYGVK